MQIFTIEPAYREANAYLAASGSVCAAFDPGGEGKRLYDIAAAKGLRIERIVLTHVHFDHILGANDLAKLTGAAVYVHAGDVPALYDPSLNLSSFACREPFVLGKDVTVVSLSEGDEVAVGDERLTVLHTPGHTPGSACFVCGGDLLTGDTLFCQNIGRTDFPGGSVTQMRRSLERLKDLPGDYRLYSGHGEETKLGRERESNPYLNGYFPADLW